MQCEITIDGIVYVRKDSLLPIPVGDYSIIRCYASGVFAGTVVKRNGHEVEIANVRHLWEWDGAANTVQLALEGVKKPQNCKFTQAAPRITMLDAIELLPCTEAAKKSIMEVPVWKC